VVVRGGGQLNLAALRGGAVGRDDPRDQLQVLIQDIPLLRFGEPLPSLLQPGQLRVLPPEPGIDPRQVEQRLQVQVVLRPEPPQDLRPVLFLNAQAALGQQVG
jgi:hypothetical protein